MHRVDLAHSASQVRNLETVTAVEDVCVAPDAGGAHGEGAAPALDGAAEEPNDSAVRRHVEALVVLRDLRVQARRVLAALDGHAVPGGGLLEALDHVIGLRPQLHVAAAAR